MSDYKTELRQQASDFRGNWLGSIAHRAKMTPDDVIGRGGSWAMHEVQVAKDLVVKLRMDIQRLPDALTCPRCFWVEGRANEMHAIPHPPDRPEVDCFKCSACGYSTEVEG